MRIGWLTQTQLTERPARRLLLSILRPFLVFMRALKPLFRSFLILLLRWFSTLFLLPKG
jgi:hypothetical protein